MKWKKAKKVKKALKDAFRMQDAAFAAKALKNIRTLL